MPLFLILAIILTVIAALAATGRYLFGDEGKTIATVAAGTASAVALLFLVLSSCAIVGTRDIGITTSFGKPVGTLQNGFHVKAPWQKVSQLDGAIHTDTEGGGWADDNRCSSTTVRLAGNTIACVDNSIQWRIAPAAGDELFRDFHDDDGIRASLVTRNLAAVLNEAFGNYNPLVQAGNDGALKDLDTSAVSKQVTESLRQRIGAQIEVVSVIITQAHFDRNTQDSLHRLQSAVADTRTSEQRQKTATADALANQNLAASLSVPILINKCLDLANAGKPLPVGFQCFDGNGGLPLTIPAR